MFNSCFELYISVGLQQTMGLASLMPIFAGNASLHCSCVCSSSVIFVWLYKVIFSEKESFNNQFLGHKNGPSNHAVVKQRSTVSTIALTQQLFFGQVIKLQRIYCYEFNRIKPK